MNNQEEITAFLEMEYRADICKVLDIKDIHLRMQLYDIPDNMKYRTFQIPKKTSRNS